MSETFPKHRKLTKKKHFKRAFGQKTIFYHDNLRIYVAHNNKNVARLGMSISKKIIKTAVRRNRIKRLIREEFRKSKDVGYGLDFVVHITKDFTDETSFRYNLAETFSNNEILKDAK